LNKYRRIEVNAYRRRMTTVSGEWRRGMPCAPAAQTEDGVSLTDSEVCGPVEPDSPEGQLILVAAIRSLEQRLSPETRAKMCAGRDDALAPGRSNRNSFYLTLRSVYHFLRSKAPRFGGKENRNAAAKQSVEN
jgi:hypothetical protein